MLWHDDWMLDETEDKEELMPFRRDMTLPRKMPDLLQSYIDAARRAYDEGNMGMYCEMEECVESEAKKMKESGKISREEMLLVFSMFGWSE